MNTTRTITHPDGHTDVETYLQDADGVWIWAVTKCNGGTMELKDARECDVNGTQVIICDVLENGAVLPHSILLDEYLNPTWEQDADSVFGFLKAAEATELQDEPTTDNGRAITPNCSVNVSQYFNGYKATATKEWAKRHLNES